MHDARPAHRLSCVPSQNGGCLVCLQPHIQSVSDLSATNICGVKFVPLWLPSQNGCLALRPQAHHQYFLLALASKVNGDFWATTTSFMVCGPLEARRRSAWGETIVASAPVTRCGHGRLY